MPPLARPVPSGGLPAEWSRRVRPLLRLLVVGYVVHAAAVLLAPPLGLDFVPAAAPVAKVALSLAGTALIVLRAVARPDERTAWAFVAAGLVSYAVGTVIAYTGLPDPDLGDHVSLSEVAWLGLFPCAYTAAMLMLREQVTRIPPSMWLDGVVGGLGAGAVGVALGAEVVAASSGRLPTVAFPVGDLLLVVVVGLLFAATRWRPEPSLRWLGLALLAQTLGDAVWLARTAAGTYTTGAPLPDLLYSAAMVLAVRAAWTPARTGLRRPLGSGSVLAVPLVFAVAAVGVLLAAGLGSVAAPAVLLAAAAVLVALARVGLTVRDAQTVTSSRLEARTDPLTGLLNRRGFTETLARRLAEAEPGAGSVAVLLLDLDRFKEVNDSLGHQAGDDLLVALSRRWEERLPAGTVLARLGGDEFAVVAAGPAGPEGTAGPEDTAEPAGEVVRALLAALAEPVALAGIALQPEVSIGVATVRAADGATPAGELLRRADIAMYRAKRAGRDVGVYRAEDDRGLDRLQAAQDLRRALAADPAGGTLVLLYQPQVRLTDGRAVGVEALVRWQHPTRGLLGPAVLLPLAEETGQASALTAAVLDLAVTQSARWRDSGLDLAVSVNLTGADLIDAQLPAHVAALLDARGVPAERLVLEVTEGALLTDRARVVEVLSALRAVGVGVSIDDYGTGYSSLSYLADLPGTELKLDRSFISRLADDPRTAAIVASTVGLAHALGLPVVAEGVETAEQADAARRAGCDRAQGYLFARPLAAADVPGRCAAPTLAAAA